MRIAGFTAPALTALTIVLVPTMLFAGSIDAGRGPVDIYVPSTYDPQTPAPLVLLLHGYSSTGSAVEAWMQFTPLAEQHGFLYVTPDGTADFLGNQFWNATDACCDIFGSTVDDSTYLRNLIEGVQGLYNVDATRIYIGGHSNGGFMAYRMACDHADLIAGIASLAGATFFNPNDCTPSEPVHVLQIHGTSDAVISYTGGNLFGVLYPGALATTLQWASYDGCSNVADTSAPPIDLDAGIPGAETTIASYTDQCSSGGSAQLWTIAGGAHSPPLTQDFRDLVIGFFLDHPKAGFEFIRGDSNGDGIVGLPDAVASLGYLFLAEPVSCLVTVDCNADGMTDLIDPLYLLDYLFGGGPIVVPPFPDCGPEPQPLGLGCDMFSCP